jgi:hypothetical protein
LFFGLFGLDDGNVTVSLLPVCTAIGVLPFCLDDGMVWMSALDGAGYDELRE